MNRLAVLCLCAATPIAASAATPLQGRLAGLSFLLGTWSNGRGHVADTGASATGTSTFTAEANGTVLLRRDHTTLRDAKGATTAEFDQIMMILDDGGRIRADYADGKHVIRYDDATVQPGHAVTFTSAAAQGSPVFTLTYTLTDPATLAVAFSLTPPGAARPRPIATGTLTRTGQGSPAPNRAP